MSMIWKYYIGIWVVIWSVGLLSIAFEEFFSLTPLPKNLVKKAKAIEEGKIPMNIKRHLKAVAPGYMEHHHGVAGRIKCHVRPIVIHKESVYTYVIGLKDTADSKPSQWLKVPIYKNGDIYGA